MRIRRASLQLRTWRLPRPIRTAAALFDLRRTLRVRVESEDGTVGWGEATPLEELGQPSVDATGPALGQVLESLAGREVSREDLQALPWAAGLGSFPAARYGLELALLDLAARADGVPLAQLLNPRPAGSVPVTRLLAGPDLRALLEQAQAAHELGIRTVKLKVGLGALADDRGRVAALRDRFGQALTLRLDANGAWTAAQACEALDALRPWAPEVLEQPVAAQDWEGWARLRQAPHPLLAADESLALPEAEARLLEGGAPTVDVLVLKPVALGGLLPSLALARRAMARGVKVYVTHALDGLLGRLGALHLAAALADEALPAGLDFGGADHLGLSPPALQLRSGALALPLTPGLGVGHGQERAA